ncbi:UNVERIFIED_CONTAM: hypothetical protein Slati_1613900 [Sesamum latifolium]|uniref:Uncharacterized protein n=1 Tax=Sesamum latifolium TaxID=2727402 RepID=A0AAW2XAQ4_9LAMI
MLGRQCGEAALQLMHGENTSISLQETSTRCLRLRASKYVKEDKIIRQFRLILMISASDLISISSINANGTKLDIVVAVQKSGFAWALDQNNGDLVWSTEAGPGSAGGGGTWGATTDKRRVYSTPPSPFANGNRQNVPSNNVTTGGFWVAMDAHTCY